jgi:hypothetical protein
MQPPRAPSSPLATDPAKIPYSHQRAPFTTPADRRIVKCVANNLKGFLMRRIFLALALMAVLTASASAHDQKLMQSISLAELTQILVEEGFVIERTGHEGDVTIQARDKAGTGLVFQIAGTACDTDYVDGCLGLNMQVRYDADSDATLQRINDANLLWAGTSIWYWEKGVDGKTPTVGVTRYVIFDGGLTVGNVKQNIINLLAIAPQAASYIWQTGDYAP